MPADVRALIREMSTVNPLWGAPRIHGELQKLEISVSQSTVTKYMRRQRRPRQASRAAGPHPSAGGPDGHREPDVGIHAHSRRVEECRASGRALDHCPHREGGRHPAQPRTPDATTSAQFHDFEAYERLVQAAERSDRRTSLIMLLGVTIELPDEQRAIEFTASPVLTAAANICGAQLCQQGRDGV